MRKTVTIFLQFTNSLIAVRRIAKIANADPKVKNIVLPATVEHFSIKGAHMY